MRAHFGFTVCVRDDDAKTYEFRCMSDSADVANRVAAGVRDGRRVRCYTLAADAEARKREEKYLTSKGYRPAAVDL